MRPEDSQRHIIYTTETIRRALERLNDLSGGLMTLVVLNQENRLEGTLTDGDVRRALISGCGLEDTVERAMFRKCICLTPEDDAYLIVSNAKSAGIALLPETDAEGKLVHLLDLRHRQAMLPIEAVLMAGGKGERLRPLTLTTPKPLLEVGGKAIIDYNIEALRSYGVERICVSVNYLKEQLIEHFSNSRFDNNVECIEEPVRLGTMGSLAYCGPFSRDNILVMNSDLLTDIDIRRFFIHHQKTEADLTMAVIPYPVSVPFAIIKTEGSRVLSLEEKPTFNNLANAGVYLMRRGVAESIVKGEYLDAPDLVERVISNGGNVSWFQIDGTWIDIGSPDDYRYACDLMKAGDVLK